VFGRHPDSLGVENATLVLGVVAVVLALHTPLFFLIQWPHRWVPGLALLPIGLAAGLILLGVVRLVVKFIVKVPPPEDV
jgi:uncharacterized membrane protein YkgB